ncbi:TPA: hypothetical protein N0F65_010543 [Lagenidium giganteum]|uniref:Uncharacterized protein n=1 Tax=Lagenidium giganteum TaxID=4803 RepID=A0AAV2ZBZ0_9STRA|nr:TPA: hypothetical protein N0F65_010543 [Lagenidium giganteum]
MYCQTWHCSHGIKHKARATGKKHHKIVRCTGCTARVNAHVAKLEDGTYGVKITPSSSHNHARNERLYAHYAENRSISGDLHTRLELSKPLARLLFVLDLARKRLQVCDR